MHRVNRDLGTCTFDHVPHGPCNFVLSNYDGEFKNDLNCPNRDLLEYPSGM